MDDRPDLAALVVPLGRRLLALEAPILGAHDITMWGYIVLSRLTREPVRGQVVLAEEIGADKTRLIDVLDDLQARGLIRRDPDPADRRTRLLEATPAGRRLRERVHRAIRAAEDEALAGIPAADQSRLRDLLERLAATVATPGLGNVASKG
jgi:MarR family transcriptional regulator, organic hydroperoxide resistance regulator